MSGIGDNLGKFLHAAKNRDKAEVVDNATEDNAEPGLGDKLRGSLKRINAKKVPVDPDAPKVRTLGSGDMGVRG